MLKATALASALTLAFALPAGASTLPTAAHHQKQALPDDVTAVETHRSPVGTIAGDALGGAVVGGLVGGGVAVYNRYGSTNGTWGNWQRDVLVGAGIGLGVGLIVGGIDAASNMDRAPNNALTDQRDVGFTPPTASYGMRF